MSKFLIWSKNVQHFSILENCITGVRVAHSIWIANTTNLYQFKFMAVVFRMTLYYHAYNFSFSFVVLSIYILTITYLLWINFIYFRLYLFHYVDSYWNCICKLHYLLNSSEGNKKNVKKICYEDWLPLTQGT